MLLVCVCVVIYNTFNDIQCDIHCRDILLYYIYRDGGQISLYSVMYCCLAYIHYIAILYSGKERLTAVVIRKRIVCFVTLLCCV